MKLHVRYFASLRERLGDGETVQVESGATLGTLRDLLIARGGEHAAALSRERLVRCALQQQMGDESLPLSDGAEVAFFPPVTGG